MSFEWMRALADLPPVLDAMLKMTLLLGVAWILRFAIRRGNPRWRVLLWRGAAVGLVLLPLLGVLLPEVSLPIIAREEEPLTPLPRQEVLVGYVPVSMDSAVGGDWLPGSGNKEVEPIVASSATTARSLTGWLRDHYVPLLAGAWLAMTGALTCFAMRRNARLRRLLKASRPAPKPAYQLLRSISVDLRCKLGTELRCCAGVASPFLIGLRRPVVALPEHMATPHCAGDLRGVLVHELAHLKLRDLLWTRVLQTLSILCWFHPLLWRARAAHATACEEVCDALAADYLGDAEGYSGTLARVALGLMRRRRALGGVPMARTPHIRVRLEALKKKLWSSRLRRGSVAVSLLAGVIAVAGLGGLKLRQVSDVFTPASGEAVPGGETSRSAGPGSRVVHFPWNRSLGALSVQDASVKRQIETFYHWINGTSWESFGEARGEVTVPAGKRLMLAVRPEGWKDLSPLSTLRRDDLYSLMFVSMPPPGPKPDDRCMPPIAHLTALKELHLWQTNITDKGMSYITKLKSLERLTIPKITDAGMACVGQLTSLKGLYFKQNAVTNAGLAYLAKLKSLEELELGGGYKDAAGRGHESRITDAGLVHLAKLPKLSYLLLWGRGFSEAGLVHLANVPSLRILNMKQCEVTDAGMEHLSRLQQLEALSFSGPPVSDKGFAYLKRMRSLKILDAPLGDNALAHLSGIKSLEHLNLPSESVNDEGLAYLSELKRLRHLNLPVPAYGHPKYYTKYYTDEGLTHLGKLTLLEELHIAGPGVTDAGMAHIGRLTNLKKLDLFGCPITGKGLAELTKLRSLKELWLACSRVTLSDLAQLNAIPSLTYLRVQDIKRGPGVLDIGKLTQLEKLIIGLQGNQAFRDEDLACLAKFTRLKWLQGIGGISDVGMAHLAGLTSIERLSVAGPGLTDKGMACLANMKNLNSLWLTGDFTDRGLRHLEGLQGLRHLNITSEDAFNNAAIERLRQKLPKLHTLTLVP